MADLFDRLDALVVEAMSEWKVPGLAVVVVQNGETVLRKGYGDRDVESGLPVTEDTHFMICSITKTFTSTGLALLVDERLLDWDKPVREYLPQFRLHDPVAMERITVRDLLCHRSGLPRHDWVWMPGDLSREEMFAAMRHLEPSKDIRTSFQYQNLGYLAAGMVAERISGLSWEEFIRNRLSNKLGMHLTFSLEELAARSNAAVPYFVDKDVRQRAELRPIRNTPAGGINASIRDLDLWLHFHLRQGEWGGIRLLSSARARELQQQHVYVSDSEFAELSDLYYCLGFGSHFYRGERVVHHSGGWIGWGALISLLPERGLGIAVLSNRDPSPVTNIVTNFLADELCAKTAIPWLDRYRDKHRRMLEHLDRAAHDRARRPNTWPSHDLAEYCGEYAHPAYGRLAITQADGRLHWAYRGLSATLAHRHYDTFELPEAPGRLLPGRCQVSPAAVRSPSGPTATALSAACRSRSSRW